MISKIKRILVLFLFLLPFGVNADNEANMILSCDKTKLAPGDSTMCTLKLNVTKGNVYSLATDLNFSENLNLDGNINLNSNVMSLATTTDVIDVMSKDYVIPFASTSTGTVDIATFKVKASASINNGSDERISLTGARIGIYTGSDGDLCIDADSSGGCDDATSINDAFTDLRIVSSVNTLSSLTISSGTLSPKFSSDTTSYSATVDAFKVTINATKTDGKSTISGNTGEVSLNYGVNTFRINVTSESGSTKTYTITITRPDNRDKNNSLSSLSLNGDVIDLKSDVSEYSYEVENDITQMRLEAILSSNKAIFVENYGSRTVELKEGTNVIEIKIKAENENIRTYTLNIKRKAVVIENTKPDADDNLEGGNGDSANNNDNVPNSPTTGSLELYIVLGIVIISVVVGLYYFNQYQKKQVDNSNDEK